ncbi:CBL-interacting serine/threonine-protein kinase 21 [Camellia lanceoleosa]|uniref:CBL-interacting serine/threonine-protein kinase 21 n=1 Tax=Camellia lanceoleosa TaxID=1840588 RepID=A0ACC0HRZ0_9ERIC|nr:CBL-interacting serine/threonine-protein kinase 21 [Camellia lanceoleosa]
MALESIKNQEETSSKVKRIASNFIANLEQSGYKNIYKVQSEIRTMKLLHHPNIVRIHEVIGTKTKIYIVMEYVSGGQLSDKMISRAEYTFPQWFTESQKKLISRILEPNPLKRITTPEIIEDQWFQANYKPAVRIECDEDIDLDDVHAAFNSDKENVTETNIPHTPSFINAFQLIAMSHDLDLSGLFQEKACCTYLEPRIKHTINETIEKIEAAAKDVSLSVERMNNSKMKIHPKQKMTRCSRSCLNLSAEVIEVAPTHCVVEISKSVGDLEPYKEFCQSLSSMLTEEESDVSSKTQAPKEVIISNKNIHQSKCFGQKNDKDDKHLRGYSSS